MAGRRPQELSGGQQQRVALARSLAPNPRLLLLDEPLSALDRGLRSDTRADLVRLQRRLGTSFVLVTHDQEEALTMADRIGVMQDGRMAQVGTPAEVYERPASRFVAEFLGAANVLAGARQADGRFVLAGLGVAVRTERARRAWPRPAGAAARTVADRRGGGRTGWRGVLVEQRLCRGDADPCGPAGRRDADPRVRRRWPTGSARRGWRSAIGASTLAWQPEAGIELPPRMRAGRALSWRCPGPGCCCSWWRRWPSSR